MLAYHIDRHRPDSWQHDMRRRVFVVRPRNAEEEIDMP